MLLLSVCDNDNCNNNNCDGVHCLTCEWHDAFAICGEVTAVNTTTAIAIRHHPRSATLGQEGKGNTPPATLEFVVLIVPPTTVEVNVWMGSTPFSSCVIKKLNYDMFLNKIGIKTCHVFKKKNMWDATDLFISGSGRRIISSWSIMGWVFNMLLLLSYLVQNPQHLSKMFNIHLWYKN